MNLFIFAHRAEAQVFFKQKPYDLVQKDFDLYQSSNQFLLISGEGFQSTTEKLAATLALYKNKISQIINYGIAGSLTDLNLNTCYSIRTVYGESREQEATFKSYTSADKNASIDCISASQRVLSDDYATYLRPFANCVDRELWAIASVAARFKIAFIAFKLISDKAGAETNCFDLSHRALQFSQIMFDHSQELDLNTISANYKIDNNEIPEGFYFTVAQERLFFSYLKQIEQKYSYNKESILKLCKMDEIVEKITFAKNRTSELLLRLNYLLNPFRAEINSKLKQELSVFNLEKTRINFDLNFETDDLSIEFKIENEKDLSIAKKALENFNYLSYKQIMNGN
jgi:hypothetical protein